MQLVINGQPRDFAGLGENATMHALVLELGIQADRVAIEQNGEIVPRATWTSHPIAEGDKLEIVHFVGGGIG